MSAETRIDHWTLCVLPCVLQVLRQDLTQSFLPHEIFDVVLSLEVAEHIPRALEAAFVDGVASHARERIILSWAVPTPSCSHSALQLALLPHSAVHLSASECAVHRCMCMCAAGTEARWQPTRQRKD